VPVAPDRGDRVGERAEDVLVHGAVVEAEVAEQQLLHEVPVHGRRRGAGVHHLPHGPPEVLVRRRGERRHRDAGALGHHRLIGLVVCLAPSPAAVAVTTILRRRRVALVVAGDDRGSRGGEADP